MSEVIFRPAGEGDLPAVGRLWVGLDNFHHSLGQAFPQPQDAGQAWVDSFKRTLGRFSFVWVVEQDGQMRGFILARLKRTPAFLGGVLIGEISDLYVDEGLRGQQAGKRLVDLALEQLRSLDVHSIEVQVMQKNTDGLAFWQKLGFQPELSQFRLVIK